MVKGLSRRIVMVRFPDTGVFEQAIFVVREGTRGGVTAERVVREACDAAQGFVPSSRPRLMRWRPLLYAAAGGAGVGAAWLAAALLR